MYETDKGFATYKLEPRGECYIREIYVLPDFRKTGEASRMADAIVSEAKEQGCTVLSGSVCPNTSDPTYRMRVLLGYGMRFYSVDKATGLMYFIKDIK